LHMAGFPIQESPVSGMYRVSVPAGRSMFRGTPMVSGLRRIKVYSHIPAQVYTEGMLFSLNVVCQLYSVRPGQQQGIICCVAFARSSLRRIVLYTSVVAPRRLASHALLVTRVFLQLLVSFSSTRQVHSAFFSICGGTFHPPPRARYRETRSIDRAPVLWASASWVE
jgi:hypothetical protein